MTRPSPPAARRRLLPAAVAVLSVVLFAAGYGAYRAGPTLPGVLLAGAYVGSVLLLQFLLSPITQGSGVAVPASTPAVAPLFRPRNTLDAFVTRLRDELGLDTVRTDLTTTLTSALHPSAVSLWTPRR